MLALALLAATAAPPGEVLTYVRSDSDGAMAERIVIYDRAPGEVWVHKSRSPCTNAAFVKARLDRASGQALELIGGRLTRELGQEAFAWLLRDAGGELNARLGSPSAEPVFSVPVGARWVLFDFDFSDMIAHPPAEIAARRGPVVRLPAAADGGGRAQLPQSRAARLALCGFGRPERRPLPSLCRKRPGARRWRGAAVVRRGRAAARCNDADPQPCRASRFPSPARRPSEWRNGMDGAAGGALGGLSSALTRLDKPAVG